MENGIERLDLGFVNAYLLEADGGFILVDTGFPTHWEALKTRLEALGCLPGKLRLIFLTHGDLDHCGTSVRVREAFGAPIAVHEAEAEWLETGKGPKRTLRSLKGRIMMAMQEFMKLFKKSPFNQVPFKPDILLSDGSSFEEFGLKARTIHAPGHTKGSTLVATEDGKLICGDVYTNRERPSASPFIENAAKYRQSLAKLSGMADRFKTVYPGHGAPFAAGFMKKIKL